MDSDLLSPGVLRAEFIYNSAPFPSCHASTIVQTKSGLLVAFFGGTRERHPDVCIYTSRLIGDEWSAPQKVADGAQPDGSRQPTWNPVLFQPRSGPLMLFYKVGPSPSQWWGEVKTSDDQGQTWSEAVRLPEGILGPIKNKPVQLVSGDIISPCSVESATDGWNIYFERSADNGKSWTSTPLIDQSADVNAIQPSILVHSQTHLQAIGRTRSARLFETWSNDAGRSWSKLALTDLPNCNSGTDAVTLADGRHLLVYNHSTKEKARYPLNVAISNDGKHWEAAAVLETEPPGQYSYPAVIQADDGLVHITYTWKRLRIKHVVIDPQSLRCAPIQLGPSR
jgi:predicted neuraminidase